MRSFAVSITSRVVLSYWKRVSTGEFVGGTKGQVGKHRVAINKTPVD